MFGWIRKRWESRRAYKRLLRDVDPRAIRELALEIRELARTAEQVCTGNEPERMDRIRNIQKDMDRLDGLTAQSEFKHLSTGKRLLLRQSLLQSRDQLVESLHHAPTATEIIQ